VSLNAQREQAKVTGYGSHGREPSALERAPTHGLSRLHEAEGADGGRACGVVGQARAVDRRCCWRGFIEQNDTVVSMNLMIEMDLTGACHGEYLKEHQYDVSG